MNNLKKLFASSTFWSNKDGDGCRDRGRKLLDLQGADGLQVQGRGCRFAGRREGLGKELERSKKSPPSPKVVP